MGKKWLAVLLSVFFSLSLVSGMFFLIPPAQALVKDDYQGDGNSLDLSQLQVGDVILTRGVKKYADLLGGAFPGYWHHAAVYVGNGNIIEAWPGGVRLQPATITWSASEAAIYRVNTSSAVKQAAVNFMQNQLGKPYDYSWLLWPGGKSTTSYYWYCSELAWAGYKVNGVDIDANPGFHWLFGYNVAPGELADDGDTYLIAHSN